MKDNINIDLSPSIDSYFSKYDRFIKYLKENHPDQPDLIRMGSEPFTVEAIWRLKDRGVSLEFRKTSQDTWISCFQDGIAYVDASYRWWQRDIVIMHELVHAHFNHTGRGHWVREDIVEYIARISRADPYKLAAALECFSVPPEIYDRSSLEATLSRKDIRLINDPPKKEFKHVVMSPQRLKGPFYYNSLGCKALGRTEFCGPGKFEVNWEVVK